MKSIALIATSFFIASGFTASAFAGNSFPLSLTANLSEKKGATHIQFKLDKKTGVEFFCPSKGKKGKENSKCLALDSLKNKQPLAEPEAGGFHPGSLLCRIYKGKPLIAKDENKDEFDICVFKDDSIINSWGLYRYHYPEIDTNSLKAEDKSNLLPE